MFKPRTRHLALCASTITLLTMASTAHAARPSMPLIITKGATDMTKKCYIFHEVFKNGGSQGIAFAIASSPQEAVENIVTRAEMDHAQELRKRTCIMHHWKGYDYHNKGKTLANLRQTLLESIERDNVEVRDLDEFCAGFTGGGGERCSGWD